MAKIVGAHSIVYSTNPEADRAFLRDVAGLPSVDVHDGWLIFALPPGEVAVHPAEGNDKHELYLMVDDVEGFVADMAQRAVVCSPARNLGWGLLTQVTLPGGGRLGVYQPRHARPVWRAPRTAKVARKKPSRKPSAARTKAPRTASRARRRR